MDVYFFSGGWGRLGSRVSGWVGLGFLFAEENEMGRGWGELVGWEGVVDKAPFFPRARGEGAELKETLFTLSTSFSKCVSLFFLGLRESR